MPVSSSISPNRRVGGHFPGLDCPSRQEPLLALDMLSEEHAAVRVAEGN